MKLRRIYIRNPYRFPSLPPSPLSFPRKRESSLDSPIKSGNDKLCGFTLAEVLITMGLIGLIAAFGLFISMDVYRNNSFHSERNIIVSVLQKARSRAVTNINQMPHGVNFSGNTYTIFQGTICGTTGEAISASNNISNSGGCVIFGQLTGTTGGASITITDGARSSVITINNEGRISW